MFSNFCHVLKGILKHFTPFLTGAALVLSALGAQAFTLPHAQKPDLTKLTYKSQNHRSALDSFRQKQIRKANAIMEAGRPQRFVDAVLQTMDRGHLKKNPKDEETDSSFNITDLLDSLSLAELTKFTREVLPMYYYQVQNRTLPVKYMTKI